jgi:hypothetical protein
MIALGVGVIVWAASFALAVYCLRWVLREITRRAR